MNLILAVGDWFAQNWMLLLLVAVLAFFVVSTFLKQKKELDQFIAQVEKEGNFLQIPKKTDKNLLQNGE